MSASRIALALGLFIVPLLLVWLGHRVRARTPALRAAFWGGVYGYGIGLTLFLGVALFPAVEWLSGSAREALLDWSLLASALIGMIVGSVIGRGRTAVAPR